MIDRETAIALAKEAGFSMQSVFEQLITDDLTKLCNLAVAHSRKDAEPVAEVCSTFELRWVGSETIANIVRRTGVRVGDKLYAHPPEADKLLQQALEVLEQYPIPTNDAKSDRLVLALRTYLDGKK